MSLKATNCILMILALSMVGEPIVNALPTVIHPSTDSSSFLPHVATAEKIFSAPGFSLDGHTQSSGRGQSEKRDMPAEPGMPVTLNATDKSGREEASDASNAINKAGYFKEQVDPVDGGESLQVASTQSEGLISDIDVRETTTSSSVDDEITQVTVTNSPSTRAQDAKESSTSSGSNSTYPSTGGEENDFSLRISNFTNGKKVADDESAKWSSTSSPGIEDATSISSVSSVASMTNVTSPTTNSPSDLPQETGTDTWADKSTDTAVGTNESNTSDPVSWSSPATLVAISAASVTDAIKSDKIATLADVSDVTHAVREGRTDDTESELTNNYEATGTRVSASPSPSTPLATVSQENNDLLTISAKNVNSTVWYQSAKVDVNRTQQVNSQNFESANAADESKSPSGELMTTQAILNASTFQFLAASEKSRILSESTEAVPFTTTSLDLTIPTEFVNASSDEETATKFTGDRAQTTVSPSTASATERPVVISGGGHFTIGPVRQGTEKETSISKSQGDTSSMKPQSRSREESSVTESSKSMNEQSEETMSTSLPRSSVYPEMASIEVTSDTLPIEGESYAGGTPFPLDILDTTPRASGDRSARRGSSSIFAACMSSVETIIVSIGLIFFTASALVICLLMGFCKRKGNTFDVQDPRNPLAPSFARSLMSRPVHHNCRVTGPAILASHHVNRLQGYDLNSPSDILMDEDGGHYTCRSRSSPSGYSVNNNNNNNNENKTNDTSKKSGEKESILLKPLHLCGPADYLRKSSSIEYALASHGFTSKNSVNHKNHPQHPGLHSLSGYKSLPGGGRFFVNDSWMLGCLPHISCSSNGRRTSLSSRTSCSYEEHTSRRHSCPPRQPWMHLPPGVSNLPPFVYHGPEHTLPFGLPGNCLKCASDPRNGQPVSYSSEPEVTDTKL